MARGDITQIVLLGGGLVLLYRAALGGTFGPGAREFVVGLRTGTPVITPTPRTTPAPTPTPTPAPPGSVGNPNYARQEREWQILRCIAGENWLDWEEFRRHEGRIGAPDPGPTATNSFMQFACVNGAPS